jgi:hypothetical protein
LRDEIEKKTQINKIIKNKKITIKRMMTKLDVKIK